VFSVQFPKVQSNDQHLPKRADTSVILIVFKSVLYHVLAYTIAVHISHIPVKQIIRSMTT